MAVYERVYCAYGGPRRPGWARVWVILRYACRELFAWRLFVALLVVCAAVPLGYAVRIYLPHHLDLLNALGLAPWTVGPETFLSYALTQASIVFFLVLLIGPGLVAPDLRNGGLALYLSRPLSRAEYVLGKFSVLAVLTSAVTWVPGLMLFVLQGSLAGWSWSREHARVALGLVAGFWVWIAVVSLAALAVSALVRWRALAALTLLAVFFVPSVAGRIINGALNTRWGSVLDVGANVGVVWQQLLGAGTGVVELPAWAAWASLLSACGVCLWILERKLRAYEVVR